MPGDYESLDPRRPVLRGISNQSHTTLLMVSAGHVAITRGRRISIHGSKVVSVEERGATCVGIGCISGCEALGELGNRVVANWFCVLVLLCDRKLLTDLNRYVLILSNSSEQNFLGTGLGIEVPFSVLGDQRDGERPVFCPDVQHLGSVGLLDQTVHLLVFLSELLAFECVLNFVAR